MRFFFLAYGLLPIWVSILNFVFALMTMRSDYAAMQLMYLMLAVPACAVTLAIAGATLAVKSLAPGDPQTKQMFAIAFCLLCTVVFAGLVLQDKHQRENHEKRIQLEKSRVAELIENHEAIIAVVGRSVSTSIYLVDSGRATNDYGVFASGNGGKLFAMVRPDSGTNPVGLTVICTTTVSSSESVTAAMGACLRNQNRQGGSAIAR
jgi:hypothetical protein